MMVALSPTQADANNPTVERASDQQLNNIIGIATDASQPLVVISNGQQQIYVQSSGNTKGFVSDINGSIKKGDVLTISPLNGVLMKADSSSTVIFGTALEDQSAQTGQPYSYHVKSITKQTIVTKISLNLDRKANSSNPKPAALVSLGKAITGHEIGATRTLIGLIIFILVFIAEVTIIYGAASGTVTAVGRNPLATNLIRKEFIRVLFVSGFVLIFGVVVIYLLLWA